VPDTPAKPLRWLTMPCDIETRRNTADRRAAWHADCPTPAGCDCPGHQRDHEANEDEEWKL
jgi:hypothetical protein